MSLRSYTVVEAPEVLADYLRIGRHVLAWTENQNTADRTVYAIRNFVKSLGNLPHRGTRRDDIRDGLRLAAFRNRTTVAFQVDDATARVVVLRVFYGGEDVEGALREDPHSSSP